MKIVIGIFVLCILIMGVSAWFIFLKGKPLPPVDEIKDIQIYYNKSFGDAEKDYEEPKEFYITERVEIARIGKLIGDLPISKMPLLNSDSMDSGKNWIINIQLITNDMLYIFVDKLQVNGRAQESSKLYEYLNRNYT